MKTYDEWNDFAYAAIVERARTDKFYQDQLARVNEKEKYYVEFLKKLSKRDKEELESYIANCENLMYILAQIAYRFGKSQTAFHLPGED